MAALEGAGALGTAWLSFLHLQETKQDPADYLILLGRVARVIDDNTRAIRERAMDMLSYVTSTQEGQQAIRPTLSLLMTRCRSGISTLQNHRRLEGKDLLDLLQSRDNLTSLFIALQLAAITYPRLGREERFDQLRNDIDSSMRLVDGYAKELEIPLDELRAASDLTQTPEYVSLTIVAEHERERWWLKPLHDLHLQDVLRRHRDRQLIADQR
jgi:hypothetical protein